MLASNSFWGCRGSSWTTHASVHSFSTVSPLSLRERCAGSLPSGQVWTRARSTKTASAAQPFPTRGGTSAGAGAAVGIMRTRLADHDVARVAVAVRDADGAAVRRLEPRRQLLRPLDREHAVFGDLVEPELVELARIL